jgi:superfamily II DNA or RNA helicase
MPPSAPPASNIPGLRPAPTFSFRRGQRIFLHKLAAAYSRNMHNHLGVFVPGYGKTLIALASFAVARAMRVADRLVVFVPRGNLRDQYADPDEMAQMLRWIGAPPLPFCVADSSEVYLKNRSIPIVVATYQYACGRSGNRALRQYCAGGKPLFVLDEIHHLPKEGTWSAAVDRLPRTSLIGLSGTPLRNDGKPLFGVPHDIVTHEDGTESTYYRALHEVSLRDAHAEGGILKRVEAHVVDYAITMVEEDSGRKEQFTLAQLKNELDGETDVDRYFARRHLRFHDIYLDTLLSPAMARFQDKRERLVEDVGADVRNHQMLIICMSNRHAADVLAFVKKKYGWLSSTRIGQDVPPLKRAQRLEAYRSGEVDIMVQVDMIGEGTDIKTISSIVKLDLVSARSKCLQQIFRGMRHYDAWDERHNVCDVFTSGDLGLAETLDWVTREVQEGIRTRKKGTRETPPEKPEQTERSKWAVTSVSESEFETHRLELQQQGTQASLRVRRQTFDRPDPGALDIKAREDKLRKECASLANELAYALQDRGQDLHIRDVHTQAKKRFGHAQSSMSLPMLRKKRAWLQRCLQMKRLL